MVKSILVAALGLALLAPVGTIQASPVHHAAQAKVTKVSKKHHKKHKKHHRKHKKHAKTTAAIHHA